MSNEPENVPLKDKAAEFLLGTKRSVEAFADKEGVEYEKALDAVVDAEIGECSVCGRWRAHEDMSNDRGEWVCFDCDEEE